MPQAVMEKTAIKLRRAIVPDIEWVVRELTKFTKFSGTKYSLRGDDKYWQDGLEVIIREHVFIIAENHDGPIGLIAGCYGKHPYNPNISMLTESFWWVDEDHRGSRAGLVLLNEFIKVGQESVCWITIATEKNSPINERCLTKRGFHLFEKSYLMEV